MSRQHLVRESRGAPFSQGRYFAAILPPRGRSEDLLHGLCHLVGIPFRDPSTFHLTLCFMGELDPGVVPNLCENLAAVNVPPFRVTIDGGGHFAPTEAGPAAIWARVALSEPLEALAGFCASASRQAGGMRAIAQLQPHITLAVTANTTDHERFLESANGIQSHFEVDRFSLLRSVPQIPGYEVERTFRLRSAIA